MNSTDMMKNLTHVSVTGMPTTWPSSPAETTTTTIQVSFSPAVTTAAPSGPDSAVIAVVIVVILLTVAVLGFLLYRYLCHNKGDYRTTGELAPGEDLDEEYSSQTPGEKKEYFI